MATMTEKIKTPSLFRPAEHAAEVQHTTDYKKFKYLPGNRPIQKYHVQQIMQSYEENLNFVELRPILVNEKMEVIDGQHRLQALEALGLPIPYIVTKGLNLHQAQMMNALQRSWNLQDFAQSYAIAGLRDYQKIMNWHEEYQIPLSVLLRYTADRQGNNDRISHKFKIGEFKLALSDTEIEDRLSKLVDFKEFAPGYWQTGPFSGGVLVALKYPEYNHERMLNGLRSVSTRRMSTVKDTLRELEHAYNYGRPASKDRFF